MHHFRRITVFYSKANVLPAEPFGTIREDNCNLASIVSKVYLYSVKSQHVFTQNHGPMHFAIISSV